MRKSRCVVGWGRRKKNQKPYYAGSWVFSEQGGGRIVIRLSLSRSGSSITKYYIYITVVLKKKRQKNPTISQFETDILIGGLNLFQWGKCVWLGIFYWDESTTWIGAWTHILCCWLPNDHCCHLTVACYYTTMNGTGDWLSLLKKGTMCEKHLWWYHCSSYISTGFTKMQFFGDAGGQLWNLSWKNPSHLKKERKKNLIMKCFKNTLFEIFIFFFNF